MVEVQLRVEGAKVRGAPAAPLAAERLANKKRSTPWTGLVGRAPGPARAVPWVDTRYGKHARWAQTQLPHMYTQTRSRVWLLNGRCREL